MYNILEVNNIYSCLFLHLMIQNIRRNNPLKINIQTKIIKNIEAFKPFLLHKQPQLEIQNLKERKIARLCNENKGL